MIAIILLVIGIILCIMSSAFFSASEMSISSANELRLENITEDGDKRGLKALKVINKFDDALSAILIGNNLVNIAASSMGSVLVILLLKTDALTWISTVVITCLVIIFGETIPKISAKKNATRFTLVVAGFLNVLMTVLKPVIWVVLKLVNLFTIKLPGENADQDEEEAIDEAIDELSSIIETAEDEDVLEEDQSELVQAAIDFLDLSAYEAMTSRVDLVAIDIDDDFDEILAVIEESQYSRIPVYEESIDNIIGILYLNHFLKAMTESETVNIRELLMPPVYVYKTTKLTSVLDQLREAKQHIAIVCNAHGATHGVLPLDDILEEIVLDVRDLDLERP
ncbi:MAG: hemolysin family protein, partial [Clostridia bacterium]|nr:hemolysin family protein [Clostridia bacterium]